MYFVVHAKAVSFSEYTVHRYRISLIRLQRALENKTTKASCDLPSSSSASSLPITSNPEDGPSAPSATVTRKHYDKTFKLKVIMFAEKFSNREAESLSNYRLALSLRVP